MQSACSRGVEIGAAHRRSETLYSTGEHRSVVHRGQRTSEYGRVAKALSQSTEENERGAEEPGHGYVGFPEVVAGDEVDAAEASEGAVVAENIEAI